MAPNTGLIPIDAKKPKSPSELFGRSAFQGLPPLQVANLQGSREALLNAGSVQGLKNEQGLNTGLVSGRAPTFSNPFAIASLDATNQKPDLGFYAQNRAVQGLPTLDTTQVATAPVLEIPAKPEVPASIAAAPKALSNFEKAIAYSKATGDTRPEVIGTRFKNAFAGLNDETTAQAQTTAAGRSRGGAADGYHDLGVDTKYSELGLPIQTTKRVATVTADGALRELKLPTIAAKAALPPKADLKKGQAYPGYGTWTGTGFRPE